VFGSTVAGAVFVGVGVFPGVVVATFSVVAGGGDD
jgi:hypothetical protein